MKRNKILVWDSASLGTRRTRHEGRVIKTRRNRPILHLINGVPTKVYK